VSKESSENLIKSCSVNVFLMDSLSPIFNFFVMVEKLRFIFFDQSFTTFPQQTPTMQKTRLQKVMTQPIVIFIYSQVLAFDF
jgi:hypothetical protein